MEIDLALLADPGDCYVSLIDDQVYSGFVVRAIEQHRCKWALGFKDRQAGRDLLRWIGAVYDLSMVDI